MKTFAEFNEWIENDFHKRNGGFLPKKLDKWYNEVDKSHAGLRKFLGDHLIQRKYYLKSQQKSISIESAKDIIDTILNLLPDYLTTYNFDRTVFELPVIPQGNHSAIRLGKHLTNYAANYYSRTSPQARDIDKALSTLGDLWAKNRTSEGELEVSISTTHKGFILLGHYGPDPDSCWRQGSDKTKDKYCLAQTLNTFVITIGKLNTKKNKYKNVARCIGFTNNNFTAFNLANYYFAPGFAEGDGLDVIKNLIEDLVKKPVEFIEGKTSIVGAFHNPYGNWTFTTDKNIPVQSLVANLHMISRFNCPKCNVDFKSEDSWMDVDDEYVCYRCLDGANRCEVSDELTFKRLVSAIDDSGFEIMIHPKLLEKYHTCDKCSRPHISSYQVEDEKIICNSCFETYYSQCEGCDKLTLDEDLSFYIEKDLCPECINNPEIVYKLQSGLPDLADVI